MRSTNPLSHEPRARRGRGARRVGLVGVAAVVALFASACQYDWLEFGGDGAHSGNAIFESTLTTANVSSLHRVWQATLPGTADGAPAFLTSVSTSSGAKSVAFVTTKAGDIVAVDAASGAQLWSKSFGP